MKLADVLARPSWHSVCSAPPLRPPAKRYPRSFPERLSEWRAMTIIAGFVCEKGILLTADTKVAVQGWMQMEAGKMFPCRYRSGAVTIFALSGDVHYAKMIIQHCEQIYLTFSPDEFTIRKCRDVLEQTLAADYATHIFPHPDPKPVVELMLGMYSPADDATALFSTQGTSVNRLYGYDCRGSGSYLGHFLMRGPFKKIEQALRTGASDPDEQVRALVLHAFQSIEQVKGFDDSCGKATDIGWIGGDGLASYITRFPSDRRLDETSVVDFVSRMLSGTLDVSWAATTPPERASSSQSVPKAPKRGRKRQQPSRELS